MVKKLQPICLNLSYTWFFFLSNKWLQHFKILNCALTIWQAVNKFSVTRSLKLAYVSCGLKKKWMPSYLLFNWSRTIWIVRPISVQSKCKSWRVCGPYSMLLAFRCKRLGFLF
jgi:hypothetical protein